VPQFISCAFAVEENCKNDMFKMGFEKIRPSIFYYYNNSTSFSSSIATVKY
jgi:hypothetical protein